MNIRSHPDVSRLQHWLEPTRLPWPKALLFYIVSALCGLLLFPITASAQEADSLRQVTPDSLAVPIADSLARPPLADSLMQLAPVAPGSPSEAADSALEHPVEFSARDSLVIVFGKRDDEQGDLGALYGEAKVNYGDTKLDAHTVEILFDIDELRAYGVESDSGFVGRPQISLQDENFAGDRMAFNMRTERGRVTQAETAYDDGFIQGEVVKRTEDSTLYIRNGLYTTCECKDDPSYSLRANKMKLINQETIVTGPIQLYLFNIPTILWLPFGLLPNQNTRRSGFLAPTYGEDEFGFYLQDMGWYFALNDYTDLQLRGGIWTSGTWRGATTFRYNRRYRFNGSLGFDFARQRSGERRDPDLRTSNRSSFRWSHNQNLDPSTTFTSSVNLSSSGYLRSVSDNYSDRVRQTIESSIRYSKRWKNAGRSLNLQLSQNQQLSTGTVRLTLPNLTFTQSSRKPFERELRAPGEDEKWFEKITYSYNFTTRNRFDFTPLSDEELLAAGDTSALDINWVDALFDADQYRRATGEEVPFDFRSTHRIPISATFSARKANLNITPNISYTEDWFIQTTRQRLVAITDSTQRLQSFDEPGFFALRQFTSSVSANTTFYGIFPWKVGAIDGFRHTVRPRLSFSYRPDFSSDFWGYSRTVTDQNGEERDYTIVTGVPSGLQQSVSFALANVFEAKRVEVDSTGQENSEVLKLFNLDANSSYNFAADSLKLGRISVTARSSLFDNKVNINLRSTFSAYRLNAEGNKEIDKFLFTGLGSSLARLTRMSISANTSFRSQNNNRGGGSRPFESTRAALGNPNDPLTQANLIGDSMRNTSSGAVDFNIPWSLSLDFTYSLSKPFQTTTRTMTANARFDFSLTPNLKVQGRTGYDFERKEAVTTNISLFKDLECWQMSLNWVPFGRYQSFGFTLQVKSGHLSEFLRIQQPKSDVSGRLNF